MTDERKTSRRQFLKGESAVEAFDHWTQGGVPELTGPVHQNVPVMPRSDNSGDKPEDRPTEPRATYLLEYTRRAMACEFSVYINAGQQQEASEGVLEILDLVEQLEDQMTVYRDHSEICAINRAAFEHDVAVEPRLFGLLRRGVELYEQTGGAFDMTAGPLSTVWGFHRRAGKVPGELDLQKALEKVGSHWLELDESVDSLRFLREGVELNLGGIGKGWALDRCLERCVELGLGDVLIHGGQSSVIARGRRLDLEGRAQGWIVGVDHPIRAETRLAEIDLCDQALGTSGTRRQSFYHQGKRYGHILDPRSGWPAECVLSSTAIAPNAADADALATAFFVMGVDATAAFINQHPEYAALLVTEGARHGTVELHPIGMKKVRWRSCHS